MLYNFKLSCSKIPARTPYPLKENKSEFIINSSSPKDMLILDIDKCEFNTKELATEERCDYLVINTKTNKAYFIELKGKHLNKAVDQLDNTIKIICDINNGYIKKPFAERYAYVVATATPVITTSLQIKEKRFKKDNITFERSNRTMTKNI